MTSPALFRAVLTLILLIMAPLASVAHEVRPAIAELNITENGTVEATLTINLEAAMAGIGAGTADSNTSSNAGSYDRLRALSAEDLKNEFSKSTGKFIDQIILKFDEIRPTLNLKSLDIPPVGDLGLPRTSKLVLAGQVPANTGALTFSWARELGSVVLRVRGAPTAEAGDKVVFAAMLRSGGTSDPIPLKGLQPLDGMTIFLQYIVIGFEHILPKGTDHILFIVGLFLLSARFSSLAWQVSGFTLAHTLTLGLAMAGVISVSPAIVEPLIAASIIYVGVENMLTNHLSRWRPFVVFGFGLLHGLGFAGVLAEIGLQPSNFVVGLIGFNLGVEFGQLTIIAICFLLVGIWFRKKPWYRARITNPASLAISIIASWWFIERVFL